MDNVCSVPLSHIPETFLKSSTLPLLWAYGLSLICFNMLHLRDICETHIHDATASESHRAISSLLHSQILNDALAITVQLPQHHLQPQHWLLAESDPRIQVLEL